MKKNPNVVEQILDVIYEAKSDTDIWSRLNWKENGRNVELVLDGQVIISKPVTYYKKRGTYCKP
jgi:hypothetical protein